MSYFNHPVKVPVFKAAITSLVERLLRKANVTEKVRMQVIFTGTVASALHNQTPNGTIVGVIRLPDLKENAVVSREKANRWVAYVIHETWHVVFTNDHVWQNFASNSSLHVKDGGGAGSGLPSFFSPVAGLSVRVRA